MKEGFQRREKIINQQGGRRGWQGGVNKRKGAPSRKTSKKFAIPKPVRGRKDLSLEKNNN